MEYKYDNSFIILISILMNTNDNHYTTLHCKKNDNPSIIL